MCGKMVLVEGGGQGVRFGIFLSRRWSGWLLALGSEGWLLALGSEGWLLALGSEAARACGAARPGAVFTAYALSVCPDQDPGSAGKSERKGLTAREKHVQWRSRCSSPEAAPQETRRASLAL